jgi:hypothetical protein
MCITHLNKWKEGRIKGIKEGVMKLYAVLGRAVRESRKA